MKIEILLATMFFENENEDFLSKMNVKTDIIVGNQCDYNKNETYQYEGHNVKVLSREDRGVGKNRNTCLFASSADVVIFADNDVQYYDNYADDIENFYNCHPDADLVIFNFKEKRGEGPLQDINNKNKRAKLNEISKFGTWAITARRESILKQRISFSLLFGGGAKYSAGEDSLFLTDCYKKGLKIYLCDATLGCVIHRESTWYEGVTEKLAYDRGALYSAVFPYKYILLILYHVFRHRKMYKEIGNFSQVVRIMLRGAKEYKSKQ